MMGGTRRLDEGLKPRLPDHMESPDIRRMFGNGDMLVCQIINKDSHARGIVRDNARKRLSLAALIGEDRKRDSDGAQLLRAGSLKIVGQIGQDHNIGMGSDCVDGFNGAINRLLPVHFRAEEILQQGPDIGSGNQFASCLVAQGIGKIAKVEIEVTAMLPDA